MGNSCYGFVFYTSFHCSLRVDDCYTSNSSYCLLKHIGLRNWGNDGQAETNEKFQTNQLQFQFHSVGNDPHSGAFFIDFVVLHPHQRRWESSHGKWVHGKFWWDCQNWHHPCRTGKSFGLTWSSSCRWSDVEWFNNMYL